MKSVLTAGKVLVVLTLLFVLPAFTLAADVIGTWTYEASGTPPEYSKGEITISQVDGDYKVVLTIGQMSLNIDNVTVSDQKVDFSVYIEDSKIAVSLTIDGDSMTGKAVSYDGTFPLKGKRK